MLSGLLVDVEQFTLRMKAMGLFLHRWPEPEVEPLRIVRCSDRVCRFTSSRESGAQKSKLVLAR